MTTNIRVHNDQPGRAISTDLWGVFFEDLNYAADGGLYAELVQNRSFEYNGRDAPGWGPLTGWETDGPVEVQTADPLDEHAPHYAVLATRDVPTVLSNSGFDGIRVEKGADYRFSVFARSSDGREANLSVCLSAPGQAPVAAVIGPISGQWKQYSTVLTGGFTRADATLVIRGDAAAAIAVDVVSLFPVDTFQGSNNGMRRDLAQAISELKPRFMRFPGGCIAHGLGLENLYRWKDTLGPVEHRRQMFNLWGYHQSMGIGYYEYFRFCQQIGATAVPVVAAGVCCQNLSGGPQAIPENEMADYVQEVLDLIAFANAPADTLWGSIRAGLGHPEPFGLRYLGVGNEDQITTIFRNRFSAIQEAVNAAHPEITIIGTVGPSPFGSDFDNGWEFARERQLGMVDEHTYKAPKWLFENVDRYDSYDRTGPAVYVGEYGSRDNRFLNALAEAAYMMGMERNGDIVRLSSYAPLLAKIDHTQWVPDLIYFDNERVLPSPNYYVQKMHSEAAGDTSLSVSVDNAPVFERPDQVFAAVGLQTIGTDVRFADVTLDGSDALEQTVSAAESAVVLPVQTKNADYRVSLEATVIDGDKEGGFAIHFGAVGTPDSFEWNFGTWRNRSLAVFYSADGTRDELMEPLPFSYEIGRTYQIDIQVVGRGREIRLSLDGELIQHYIRPDRTEQRFTASAVNDGVNRRTFVKIVNATGVATECKLDLASPAAPVAMTVFAGPPDGGAAFESAPFTPRLDPVPMAGAPLFLQPYSFTILEFKS